MTLALQEQQRTMVKLTSWPRKLSQRLCSSPVFCISTTLLCAGHDNAHEKAHQKMHLATEAAHTAGAIRQDVALPAVSIGIVCGA